jgi:hypothetical protein
METVPIHRARWCYILEDLSLDSFHTENFATHNMTSVSRLCIIMQSWGWAYTDIYSTVIPVCHTPSRRIIPVVQFEFVWPVFSGRSTNAFDVCGSVHYSIIHTEIANKMQQCIKIYYSMFVWSSACFGRHTAHHQELKTALAASGFAYVKGCWTLRLLVQFWAPDDGRCVAQNMLNFIQI